MNRLTAVLAATLLSGVTIPATPAFATNETPEAVDLAGDAAANARADMIATFGDKALRPGQYLWDATAPRDGDARVIISLSDQLAFVYRGEQLVAVSTISSGKPGKDTPVGIFPILAKKAMHRSSKYDDAPMPFMQRIDDYGIALHAGMLPGHPASHGCVRLPLAFAHKLFTVTDVGTEVMIAS